MDEMSRVDELRQIFKEAKSKPENKNPSWRFT